MSLPNNLKCNHTVTTSRWSKEGWVDGQVGGGILTLHEPQVCVRSTWAYETGVRKETWYTTDSQIVCFTHPWHSRIFFFLCFKICSKWTVTVFSAWLDVSFVLVGAALFSTSWKANVVRLMLARKQNKGRWEMGYNFCLLLFSFIVFSSVNMVPVHSMGTHPGWCCESLFSF